MADRRRLYAPPQLVPLTYVSVTKHVVPDVGTQHGFGVDVDAEALLAKFGSPLFVVSEQQLRDGFRAFLDAFSDAGVDTRIAYSYKTNYVSAICAILHQEGAWAEVVSGVELSLVEAVKRGQKNLAVTLLSRGVDVNGREEDGTTALHWAVRANDAELVASLLRAGANANATNRYGIMPLWLAATNGSAPIVTTAPTGHTGWAVGAAVARVPAATRRRSTRRPTHRRAGLPSKPTRRPASSGGS